MESRLFAIAETFNPERECIDLDLDQTAITWDDIDSFLKENNISHQSFSENIVGGMIARETVTRCINKRLPMSRYHRFMIVFAFKYRKSIIESAPKKYSKEVCYSCGR